MNLAPLTAYLTADQLDRLAASVAKLEKLVAAGALRAIDIADAKFIIGRMVERAVDSFDKANGYGHDVMVSGAYSVPAAIKDMDRKSNTKRAAFLRSLLPLHQLLEAAKPLVVKRQPGTKTAKQVAREAFTMTCQCCGRAIFAETGTIAHHGYERPGEGWQTASCMGAKFLPFEVARERLGDLIRYIESHLVDLRASLARVQSEAVALSFHYSIRPRGVGFGAKRVEHHVAVTRETFDDVRAAYESEMRNNSVHSFDDIKSRAVASLESSIRNTESDRKTQQARFDGWKQTHRRDGAQWVAL